LKLCSYRVHGRTTYGAGLGDGGIVELAPHFPAHPSLLSLVRSVTLPAIAAVLRGASGDHAESEVEFLPVFDEGATIHCVGLNYADHTAESGMVQPPFPRTFFKCPTALVGHGQPLEMPALSGQFDFEGELAVVLARPARNVTADRAMDYVLGYTPFMDGSVRDYQLQRTLDQGKNFYRSSAVGPYLVTADEVGAIDQLTLRTYVSGELMQEAKFSSMIFPVSELIEYISHITELKAGDMIATGTPAGVGFTREPPRWLRPGDVVEVNIERVGRLSNAVGPAPLR